nr:MAG TPA: hypothetical protein [Caudoviricetes sp.]
MTNSEGNLAVFISGKEDEKLCCLQIFHLSNK